MKSALLAALLIRFSAGLFLVPVCAESVTVKWEKTYNGPANSGDIPTAVAVDSAGNVIVTGCTTTKIGANPGDTDYYTAKYAAVDGALLWERLYDGPSNKGDKPTAVVLDSAGNVIVTGTSSGDLSITRTDYYTVKYSTEDGALIWERRYNGPANGLDSAYALAVDNADNVIVTGNSSRTKNGENYDIYTVKYAADNGAMLWEKRSNGPQHSPRALAVDTSGNVSVTSWFANAAENNDFYTAKHAASTGALIWEKRHNGPINGEDFVQDVAMDNEGNVIVTGSSDGIGNSSFYTAKYAAANGALLWEARYDGPGYAGAGVDVEADSAGNAIVTGFIDTAPGNRDFYTAKYAAANGALIWEQRYNGTGNGDDAAHHLAVESAGSIVIVGLSLGSGANFDFYTAKYAAGNGALLWERRDEAVAYSYNDVSLALTPDGGVVVAGTQGVQYSDHDFYAINYAPVDLDNDDDGLLDSWEIEHFGGIIGQGALDDTDGDGAGELLELAFGTDARSPASVPAPVAVVEDSYLTITIAKQPGVTYLVQASASPRAGFSAADTTVLTDNAIMLKVRDNFLVGTQAARFLRVQVTAAP